MKSKLIFKGTLHCMLLPGMAGFHTTGRSVPGAAEDVHVSSNLSKSEGSFLKAKSLGFYKQNNGQVEHLGNKKKKKAFGAKAKEQMAKKESS